MVGIDCQRPSGVGFNKPRELHERTASRIEDDLLDVLSVAFNPMAITGYQEDLRRPGCG